MSHTLPRLPTELPAMAVAAALTRVQLHNAWGAGQAFFSAWQAWRDARDARATGHIGRDTPAIFIVVDAHLPWAGAMLAKQHGSVHEALAQELAAQWPADGFAPNLHRLRLDDGQVSLWLLPSELSDALREIDAPLDTVVLHTAPPVIAADARQGAVRLFKALARLAVPDCTLDCAWLASSGHAERDALAQALRTAGFETAVAPATADATLRARYAPRFTPRTRTAKRQAPSHAAAPAERRALILGGGLAGCAAAWALAEAGWRSTVLDRHAQPAQETSGNPGGLYHGVVNGQDGTHARFNRAAALMLERLLRQWASRAELGLAPPQGLLRLAPEGDASDMQALLDRLGLPAAYVQALDAPAASALAGLPLPAPAWHYPGGGWLPPAALCQAYLHAAAQRCDWRGNHTVASIERIGDQWCALDGAGTEIARAPVLVIAMAGTSWPLLRSRGLPDWPVDAVRGQISIVPGRPGAARTALPLAGSGYALPEHAGELVFGATAQRDDADPAVREADHAHNLAQLQRLMGKDALPWPVDAPWRGRVGWRQTSDDRLPVVGAVPRAQADAQTAEAERAAPEHPRHVETEPGLFVLSGLGSRGITWSALAAQVLAAHISGQPVPLESSLVEAIAPARFACRPPKPKA